MNTKIALSGLSILAALALVAGATFAFFSDTETSRGNRFVAGDLDLQIDNTSYLNRVLNEATTWRQLDDLPGHLFFNFDDLKPGDEGEDTISLHVTNDAWACADFNFTIDKDNGCGGDESGADPTCGEPNDPGELGSTLNFIFWADDGDNVLEQGEGILSRGIAADVLNSPMTLADSKTSPVGGLDPTDRPLPLRTSNTYYIGKAWCYGNLTEARVPSGQGISPAVDPGVKCDGSLVSNASETDVLSGDVRFRAEQFRNNPNFQCNPTPTPTPTGTP